METIGRCSPTDFHGWHVMHCNPAAATFGKSGEPGSPNKRRTEYRESFETAPRVRCWDSRGGCLVFRAQDPCRRLSEIGSSRLAIHFRSPLRFLRWAETESEAHRPKRWEERLAEIAL